MATEEAQPKQPKGWSKPWLVSYDEEYGETRIVVDEEQFHETGGAISVPVAEIGQSDDTGKELADYIVALHNQTINQE